MEAMRLPPSNPEAEKSVLGAMLLDSQAAMRALELLRADDFYIAAHRKIFQAMQALNAQNAPVDVITLENELSRSGALEGIGGIDMLIALSRFVPSAANIQAYIQIVEEKSTLRRLIAAADSITATSYEGLLPMSELLNNAERSIYDITMKKGGNPVEHIHPVLCTVFSELEELVRNRGQIMGVPLGFSDLDHLTTGLHGGELVLIAARPSMGKTAFALNLIQHAALAGKKKCAFFSLEMPREQLATRMLCCEARVDMQRARKGELQDDDWGKLVDAMGALSMSSIYVDDSAGMSVSEMRSRCRRLQMEHGLDVVFIDYLQLLSGSGKSDSRQNEVSEISRSLKTLALEMKIPIVALSQLSRAAANRADHRPILSDLRDSGAIEQDADIVMFLHREDYYDRESQERNVAEVIIAKQRNGPLGTVKLGYAPEYTRFANL